jgi:cob(I)alamin adenosyltransferase
MGNRLSKIYTRTGDDGSTGLATGERVPKHDARIATTGDVDELNSALALILAEEETSNIRSMLLRVQQDLFEVGAELSLPGYSGVTDGCVRRLEQDLDLLNDSLPPLQDFVLPGGPRAAAACHLARAVCRRAERSAWYLAETVQLNPTLLRYLNRLSDLLFVMARHLTLESGAVETLWTKRTSRSDSA